MKLRIAKKVMHYNPNAKMNMHYFNHLRKLRPSYINEQGRLVLPSCHDVHLISKARTRLFRWIRRVRDRYQDKYATFEVSDGHDIVQGKARIVKWNKKYVWLSCTESGIRFSWSSIIKVE